MTEAQFPKPEMDKSEMFRTPGFAWRVGVSIAVVFGWLAFLIVWLFFYAGDFEVLQNVAIFLVSVIVGVGILAAVWATWGIRYAKSIGQEPHMEKPMGATVVSIVAGVGWLVFLVVWLFFYADTYTAYQNLAIFIASIMVLGAIAGVAWVIRWVRTGRR